MFKRLFSSKLKAHYPKKRFISVIHLKMLLLDHFLLIKIAISHSLIQYLEYQDTTNYTNAVRGKKLFQNIDSEIPQGSAIFLILKIRQDLGRHKEVLDSTGQTGRIIKVMQAEHTRHRNGPTQPKYSLPKIGSPKTCQIFSNLFYSNQKSSWISERRMTRRMANSYTEMFCFTKPFFT